MQAPDPRGCEFPYAATAASAGSRRRSNRSARGLGPDRFERLVSALAVVIGWEAFVVLFDVRGLSVDQARETIAGAAITLIDAALAQVGTESDSPN